MYLLWFYKNAAVHLDPICRQKPQNAVGDIIGGFKLIGGCVIKENVPQPDLSVFCGATNMGDMRNFPFTGSQALYMYNQVQRLGDL